VYTWKVKAQKKVENEHAEWERAASTEGKKKK
jgi:hypothetical protein